jgi:alkanesulfonate monooxygenase SsuD/methylene tetrahydromethanopterin reductase-like flavin-dependent oxidoreductase (luciferase family)
VLDRPHVMVACNVFAADTVEEARFLATTMQQGFVALRTGQGGGLVSRRWRAIMKTCPHPIARCWTM